MTRILSELLHASEPHFRLQLGQLERVSGHTNADIKLSVEIVQSAKQKIHQLGLDRNDTTAPELYHMLHQRISADDQRLERALRTRAATYVNAEADVMQGMVHALQAETANTQGFSLKSAALKRQLKKLPPKRLVKSLGYRSFDAMIRHESPAVLVAAAYSVESAAWRRDWLAGYKQLTAHDFETAQAQVICPSDRRWQTITQKMMTDKAHTVLSLPELGTVVLLPLPAERPAGMVLASTALVLHELNALAAASSYLRASQVHGDFARRLQMVAKGQVTMAAPHMPQAMSWQLVQRYFATTKAALHEDVFGPYAEAADFYWHDVEAKLTALCPSLEFWQGTSYLSFLHDGASVSMNILDVAINSCNQVVYEARSAVHAQAALWNELMVRYVDHASLERAVASVLQPKLALETASNE